MIFGTHMPPELQRLEEHFRIFYKGKYRFRNIKHPFGTHYDQDATVTEISDSGRPLLEITSTEILDFPVFVVGWIADEARWSKVVDFLSEARLGGIPPIGFYPYSGKDFFSFRKFLAKNHLELNEVNITISVRDKQDKLTSYAKTIFLPGKLEHMLVYGFSNWDL